MLIPTSPRRRSQVLLLSIPVSFILFFFYRHSPYSYSSQHLTTYYSLANDRIQGWINNAYGGKWWGVEEEEEEEHMSSNYYPEFFGSDRGLPECERTMLYKFSGSHGFASEYLILLRLYLLSTSPAHNFTFLIPSPSRIRWNYGPFTSYFQPPPPTYISSNGTRERCRVQNDWETRRRRIIDKDEKWRNQDHVFWNRRAGLDWLDALVLEEYVGWENLEKLREKDDSEKGENGEEFRGLEEERTVPVEYRNVWSEMGKAAKEIWKLNDDIEEMVRNSEEQVGLNGEGQSVGVHVRMGDKFKELSNIINSSSSNSSTLTPSSDGKTHLTASDSQTQIYFSLIQSIFNNSKSILEETEDAQKQVLVVSDDESTVDVFRDLTAERGLGWEIKSTVPTVLSKSNSLSLGFHEVAFNSLPLESRIQLGKEFIRDITILSRKSKDGIVFTGSSNVGRLLGLLWEGELGEGRVRSADVRWFPTSHFV